MGGVKVDIIWSPNHEDRFVTFGTDLSLFKLEPIKDAASKPQGAMKISDESVATLLSVNSENQFIKCLAWYPKPNPDYLLAVGLANGKVILSSFGKGGTSDPHGLIGREFVPKHARQCNHLAWNLTDSNLLAEGLDKYRTDHSVLIWDVNVSDKLVSEKRFPSSTDHSSVTKPLVELGPTSETTLSLAWFCNEAKTLVTGMNHKYLKIFDLREIMRPQCMTYTKVVYGVCVDPHFEYRLASFAENSISVWDVRNFDKPVLTLPDNKPVLKINWSPTRSGLLSALHKDSSVVKLYDIQNMPVGSDELEPAVIERVVMPLRSQILSSFDWHPSHDNRMLTASTAGHVRDVRVFERISLGWSSDIYLTWACGRQMVQCNTIKLGSETNEDISIKMRRRALHGYGLKNQNVWHNAQLVGNDTSLRNLWHWLHYIQGLHPIEDVKGRRNSPGSVMIFQGVKSILVGENSLPRSEAELLQWQGLEGQKVRGGRKFYTSEERSLSLQLCSWGHNRNQYQLNDALARLETEGNYERAAAIALFNLNMKHAIEILQRASSRGKHDKGSSEEGNLSVVAMALSGFTEDNLLWQQLCSKEKTQLKNPYLRTMFAFLTTEQDHYEDMLNDSEIETIDKVAFASMYLSDSKLADFIKKLSAVLVEKGNLDGILLTGLGVDGLDLLEHYVDRTCDVQTASLVALQGMQLHEVTNDPRPSQWIESYRNLLDQWKLWHQRAEFDLYQWQHHRSCEARPMPQVFASCNFCGKSIAYNMLASRNRSYILGGTTAHRPKVTSCPNCRKPLPRCALCLINMGTPAGQGKAKAKDPSTEESARKLTPINDWFTWCQSCRHGGHAHHLMEWFRDHGECPVTGCACRCTSLDSLGNVNTETTTSPLHRPISAASVS